MMPRSAAREPTSPPADRRGGPGAKHRRPGRDLVFPIGRILTALIVFVAISLLLSEPSRGSVSYRDFRRMLRANEIADVVVESERIRATLKREGTTIVTTRMDDPGLLEELEARHVSYTARPATTWIDSLLVWIGSLVFLVLIWTWLAGRMGAGPSGAMAFSRSRARIYAEDDVKVTFADVAGIDEATGELREIVDFLQHPTKYTNLGGRIPKGVLLLGPPGTGKTLLARAVAGEAKVPFFSLSGSEFVEMFVGVGAARIRDLFAQAEERAPCIVFIDELDAVGKMRMASSLQTHEEREQTLNQLLAEMDGFDPRKGVIIMAATNRPEVLDPALLRPGRFDRQVVVDKPDVHGREAILGIHVRGVRVASGVDLAVIAARTAGFAGADLANLVNEAALLAARRDAQQVEMRDFEEAIDRLMTGLEKKRVMSPKERERVAYHEAGHAIVATVLPGVDRVHKISIVQRGYGALGHTLQLPIEERYLVTRTELQHQLAVLLAGRSAERSVFGEISTGAQNDLQRATDIARAMVTEYGMSEALGAVSYDGHERPRFLGPTGMRERAYAEDTARRIDAEVKRLVADAEDLATRTLEAHRGALDVVTRALLEREVVEGAWLRDIVAAPTTSRASSTAPTAA